MREQLSKNFYRDEFVSGDGNDRHKFIDCGLVNNVLQPLRDHFARPLHPTSGNRSPQHNRKIRGSKRSWHMTGGACDFWIEGISPLVIANYIRDHLLKDFGCVIVYDNFVHVDLRSAYLDLDSRTGAAPRTSWK